MPNSAHISLHIHHPPAVTIHHNKVRTDLGNANIWTDPDMARRWAAALIIAADEADPPSQDIELNVAATLAIAAGGDA